MNYFLQNLQTFVSSTGQLARHPGAALMTIAAIGVTLALPTLFYVTIQNVARLSGSWDGQAHINLFLNQGVEVSEDLVKQLRSRQEVQEIKIVDPEKGLEDFKLHSGFQEAIDLLETNPLPWTIIVDLYREHDNPDTLQNFLDFASNLPDVEQVRSDVVWLKRLNAMVAIAERLVWILAILLAVAAIVIISNTIRLAILNKRQEIEVIKLIGGTNRFIQRPFLYQGLLQGSLGAVAAVLLVTICVELLRLPITQLMGEYDSDFVTVGLSWRSAGSILAFGALIGYCASRWSVGQHLTDIEP